jgi:hypothetical protein
VLSMGDGIITNLSFRSQTQHFQANFPLSPASSLKTCRDYRPGSEPTCRGWAWTQGTPTGPPRKSTHAVISHTCTFMHTHNILECTYMPTPVHKLSDMNADVCAHKLAPVHTLVRVHSAHFSHSATQRGICTHT